MGRIFSRTDVLLPQHCDLTKWSVIACDQYTSDPAYWDALYEQIHDAPSSLWLMLPEVWLDEKDLEAERRAVWESMERCLDDGVFRELKDSYVYLERSLRSGTVRPGLLGALDLEAYDYRADSTSPVRATEGTVESRLPARMFIRDGAPLEMPHVMVFYDDPEDRVLGALSTRKPHMEPLYDFDLIADGGHLRGCQVSGADADRLDAAMDALFARQRAESEREGRSPLLLAMGDGNHSLAAAKACWEKKKQTLTPEQRETDPARRALVELVNIHDPSITFEPIHRCVWTGDPAAFLRESHEVFADRYCPGAEGRSVRIVTPAGEAALSLDFDDVGSLIAATDAWISDHLNRCGGRLDYVHNDEAARSAVETGGCAVLLPKLEKSELFASVRRSGPFPRKSFSIGRAEDKRYYLECRKIN